MRKAKGDGLVWDRKWTLCAMGDGQDREVEVEFWAMWVMSDGHLSFHGICWIQWQHSRIHEFLFHLGKTLLWTLLRFLVACCSHESEIIMFASFVKVFYNAYREAKKSLVASARGTRSPIALVIANTCWSERNANLSWMNLMNSN